MPENPLSIIKTDSTPKNAGPQDTIQQRMQEAEAKYERLWLANPDQFDPLRKALGRRRIKATLSLIKKHCGIEGKKILDIGSGSGLLSKALADLGGEVTASDISQNALKLVPDHLHIKKKRQALPLTKFEDGHFDFCLCTEVIATLDQQDYRLAMAELCRVIKPDGRLICSTPIDIYSEDALSRFAALAETEFKILNWKIGYFALYLKLLHFFKSPYEFFKGFRDKKKREEGLKKRRGLYLWWYKINSRPFPAILWAPVSLILSPLVYFLEQNTFFMLSLEKLSQFFQQERGISHVIFIGRRRPLFEENKDPPLPNRPPFKREIKWE